MYPDAHQFTAPAITTAPLVSFGCETCGDLSAALRREWLVTNGLGGYASGALAGINTRRYHGLLVASLTPPVARTVLVAALDEWAVYASKRYPLSAHEYGDGVIHPHGYRHLQSFALEGMLPVWTFALGDALLERRIWMALGANTTYITYSLLAGDGPVDLELTPLVTYRDFHSLSLEAGRPPRVTQAPGGAVVEAFAGAHPFRVLSDRGQFTPGGAWWWNFYHRAEAARGLDTRSDLYAPGTFRATLAPPSSGAGSAASSVALIATAEAGDPLPAALALESARERQLGLLRRAASVQPDPTDPVVQQLTLAADQFLVERLSVRPIASAPGAATPSRPANERAASERHTTVIAGYPWFNDWGRDTMIALPGLTLATGRSEDAASILRAFAGLLDRGMCPNNFPDRAGVAPAYNTADATLWYALAIRAYEAATGDRGLVNELLPGVREIAAWHLRGTRYGIRVDPADGLLRAGEPGVQLTWMDAKVGDYVVTPRIGKPVEINALWHTLLRTLAAWLAERGDQEARQYEALAERARVSFRARFRSTEREYLADVVDGPNGDDWSLRPNQLLAFSLPYPLLAPEEAAPALRAVERSLLTTYGLRTLSPDDPTYRGEYGGDQLQRDLSYHQGAVWPWLLGAYLDASLYVRGEAGRALAVERLRPLVHHLRDAGLGSVSEIFAGDPPHRPDGCIAQAWSVAEALRMRCRLDAGRPNRVTLVPPHGG